MQAPKRGRGYFAVGVERLSKPKNAGNLFRTAHAFGASFLFTVGAEGLLARAFSDTSRADLHLPVYEFAGPEALALPEGCRLVGVELDDTAQDLPTFHHPLQAAYVLGPERGGLSPALLARCEHLVRIPTAFSLNVATAGAVVLYDRLLAYGRYARRPVSSLSPPEVPPPHVQGGPRFRRRETAGKT
jgi:tRNA G18 (ribose-2'-O)-methylase SpoU